MKIIILCFCLYLILCPFYFFPSGQPQVADFVLSVAVLAFFFQRQHVTTPNDKVTKYLKWFVIVVVLVNLAHFVVFAFTGTEIAYDFLLSLSYYIFNAFVFVIALSIFKNNTLNIFYYTIIVSLLIQVFLGVLGITGAFYDGLQARTIIFFNNPNQLGYYALLMQTLFVLISFSAKKTNILILSAITLMCLYLSLLSGSRAAMGGVFLLLFLCIFLQKELSLIKIFSMAFLLIILVVLFVNVKSDLVESQIYLFELRQERDRNRDISQFELRGYDRIIKYPEHLFFGAGEGQHTRFANAFHQGELHSGMGTILFSYGILGTIFFVLFIKRIIQDRKWLGLFILLPVVVYNLTHQGLRQSLLWMMFALLYYVCSASKYETKQLPQP